MADWYLPNPHKFLRGDLVFYKKSFASTPAADTYLLEAFAIANQTWQEALDSLFFESPAAMVCRGFAAAGWGDYLIRDFYWCSDDALPPTYRDLPLPKHEQKTFADGAFVDEAIDILFPDEEETV